MEKNIRIHITDSFQDVTLEPIEHVYTSSKSKKTLIPVSNIVAKFKNPFDTKEKSKSYAEKYGLVAEEVEHQWKEAGRIACDQGTEVHEFAERYFYDNSITPNNGFENAVIKFWKRIPKHIIPLISESRIYSDEYKYAGTSDNLFYNTLDKSIIISDYKTNKNLFKNFAGQTMLDPFEHLLDNPFNNYQVQLSLYQIPIEDLGYKVSERWVVWLKPDSTFEKFEAMDFTSDLRQLFNSKNYNHAY